MKDEICYLPITCFFSQKFYLDLYFSIFIFKSKKCISKNIHTIFSDKIVNDYYMPYFMLFSDIFIKKKFSNIWSIGQIWPEGQNTNLNISITRGQVLWSSHIYLLVYYMSAKSETVASIIHFFWSIWREMTL